MSYETTIADLWLRNSLRNAKEENFKDKERRIAKGIERIPVHKIMEDALYIDNFLLPRIAQSRGEAHADYKFFRGVYRSLLWACALADRNEYIEMRHAKDSLLLEFFKEHSEKLERQMNKYIAMEDLFFSTSLDIVAEGVGQRARDLLQKK